MHPIAVHLLVCLRRAELVREADAHRCARAVRRARRLLDPRAVADLAPVVLAVLPLGMVVGVTAHEASVGAATGVGTAILMFGAAANLAALTLTGSGAGVAAVLGAVAIVNSRLALYGAGLEPRFRGQPAWFRWLAPLTIVDQTYALATARPELADPAHFRRWWLTAGAVFVGAWAAAVAAGVAVAGAHLPLFITVVPAARLPEPVQRALRHTGPAALAALVGTALVAPPPAGASPLAVPAALLVGAVVAWRTRSMLASTAAAIGAFALISL